MVECWQNTAKRYRWIQAGTVSQPLLLGSHRLQAMVEKRGAIPGQHLLEVRLHRTFALAQLLGPALLGSLAEFGRNLVGIDQRLSMGGGRRKQRDGGDENVRFQMCLQSGILARAVCALKPEGAVPRSGVVEDLRVARAEVVCMACEPVHKRAAKPLL